MTYRVKVLMSDTGGGHRAAAEAIREALVLQYGADVEVELIDGLLDYAPYPFRRFPDWYPAMSSTRAWEPGYRLIDGRRRTRALHRAVWPYVRRGIRRLVRDHPCDVIVSVHLLLTGPVLRALGAPGAVRPPVVNVVTDLVTTHALWYEPRADMTLVPTTAARQRALECNVPAERVRVIGLPVSPRFDRVAADQRALRKRLGWQVDAPTALLLGGGFGMGQLAGRAQRLAHAGFPLQLAVVCGHNTGLYQELRRHEWPVPVAVYRHVRNMAELMRAADVVVTKAGPATVMEALQCGRPLILSSAIPGQEEGNVEFVIEHETGVWAPGLDEVEAAVRRLLVDDTAGRRRMAANARRVAQPGAATMAAREIGRFFPPRLLWENKDPAFERGPDRTALVPKYLKGRDNVTVQIAD